MSNLYNNPKFFCELCENLSISSLDYGSKISKGICRSCELKFFEPNRDKWNAGWRPGKKEIDSFNKESQKSVYSILSKIINYI